MQVNATRKIDAFLALAFLLAFSSNSIGNESVVLLAKELESRLGARIGVAVKDTHTGRQWSYRGDERFPLTSTFKPLACAAILAQVDAGNELLERRLRIGPPQIVVYSPITTELSGGEISLERACEAAITVSDNTAANLVLDALGGPTALTDFFRTVGDEHSRLDRTEPKLNEAVPGDPRDTTTPNAIVGTLETLVNGRVLGADSKQTLERWMSDNKVGDALFRSRLPEGWRIADKTGAGGYGSRALIALVRPSNRGAAFVAVYVTNTDASFADRNEAIAEIGAGIFTLLALPQ